MQKVSQADKKQLPFYKDTKRMAWVVWNFIKNNKINRLTNLLFTVIEYIQLYFFIMLIPLEYCRDQIYNAHGNEEEMPRGLLSYIVRTGFLETYQSIQKNEQFLIISSYILASINFLLLLSILFMAAKTDSPSKAAKSSIFSAAISALFYLQSKLLFLFEIWVVVCSLQLKYISS